MEDIKDALSIFSDGEILVAALAGEIDHHAARPIRERIDSELYLSRPTELCLDFSKVRFMDSSAIALIIGRSELARSIGSRVRVTGLSSTQKRLVRLSGVERIEGIVIENTEVKK